MYVSGAKGKQLATIDIAGKPDKVLGANVNVLNTVKMDADVKLEVQGDGLLVHMKVPKQKMAWNLVITPADIGAILAGVDGSVIKFALKALMKKGRGR